MLKSKKHVFWEALFVTVVIFVAGLLFGFALESSRLSEINNFYTQSEITLMDIFAFNNLLEVEKVDCETLTKENINFANRIYEEAKLLSQYEEVEKLTESTKFAHKRYDLMRTLLWINTIKTEKECGKSINTIIYLYELETEDLAQKATQNVWSKILLDLKEKQGNNILLIPIAADNDISSLKTLLEKYPIERYPVVIINNKVISELKTAEDLENYLDY
ncbi:MAG: hypothetical protein PVJ67_06905 [Candidatus Pacearchaeota archaeon]|jgi:hypothetical protein